MKADDLFTAPQVAKICSTDLKTIHNWVNRGEIKSFRTPGRHLRFRRQDVLDFLTRFGYPVPEGFSPARKRIVVLDQQESVSKPLKRALSRDFEIEAYVDHIDALLSIGRSQPNLVLVSADGGPSAMHLVERLTAGSDGPQVAMFGYDTSTQSSAITAGGIEFIPVADGKEIKKRVASLLK